jgi:hypothetical protein
LAGAPAQLIDDGSFQRYSAETRLNAIGGYTALASFLLKLSIVRTLQIE